MTRRSAGFTLIEVLVAMVIVAVILSACIKAAGALTNNAQRMVEVTGAQWCAENQLVALKLPAEFPNLGTAEFACEQLGLVYRGKLVVQPTNNPNLRRVDAEMANEDGRHILSISTVRRR